MSLLLCEFFQYMFLNSRLNSIVNCKQILININSTVDTLVYRREWIFFQWRFKPSCKLIYERSYISTAEKDMQTWSIITVIHTTGVSNQLWNWSLKKIRSERDSSHDLCDTGAVLSTELSSLSHCDFVIYLYKVKDANEYKKDDIFELRRKIWRLDWSWQLYTQLSEEALN